jgi:hypothetical protein
MGLFPVLLLGTFPKNYLGQVCFPENSREKSQHFCLGQIRFPKNSREKSQHFWLGQVRFPKNSREKSQIWEMNFPEFPGDGNHHLNGVPRFWEILFPGKLFFGNPKKKCLGKVPGKSVGKSPGKKSGGKSPMQQGWEKS